jgi:hypothetical protein
MLTSKGGNISSYITSVKLVCFNKPMALPYAGQTQEKNTSNSEEGYKDQQGKGNEVRGVSRISLTVFVALLMSASVLRSRLVTCWKM